MLFTKHGDAGYTSVIGGSSLLKCDVRLEALGALDEAQAHLGLARAMLAQTEWAESIRQVQADLRLLMTECAIVPHNDFSGHYLTQQHVDRLESDISSWEETIGDWTGFITPGDTVPGARLHLARTVIRRAERQVVALCQEGGMVNPWILSYLNRLSSWVYALAMTVDKAAD